MYRPTRFVGLGLLVASAVMTAATAGAQQSDEEWLANCQKGVHDAARVCEVRPVSLAATGHLRVDARPNGGVSVTAGRDGAVSGSARLQAQAETEQEARALLSQVQIQAGPDGISAAGPKNGDNRSWSATFALFAPKHQDLEILATNGPVSLTGINGRITATSVNGPIALDGVGGDVKVRMTNGPLTVVLDGNEWAGAGLDAELTNGPVTIKIPEGYSANLDAGTVNGPLSLGFPVTVQGDISEGRRSSVQATLGSGGAPIRVHTVNGPLRVTKR
jgi:hypothetical protein